MDLTGGGDHPAILKALKIIGTRIGEGKLVTGAGPSPTGQPGSKPKNAAQALFPNLPSSANG